MDERQVNVIVENDVLSIRGERNDHREGDRRSYREAGIAYGPFGVDVFIPFPVEADDAEADYANGFLRIRLPKSSVRTIVPKRPDEHPGGD